MNSSFEETLGMTLILGDGPVACASRHGHDAVVEMLLRAGASLLCRDARGKSPGILAAEVGDKGGVE